MKTNSVLFEEKTLEIAYEKASLQFQCSIADLKSEVIQAPSNGLFGLFKKNAIIKVYKNITNDKKNESKSNNSYNIKIKDVSSSLTNKDKLKEEIKQTTHKKEKIFDEFYDKHENKKEEKHSKDDILIEIEKDINELFLNLNFEINKIEVSFYDEKTIYIKFDGIDSALLIGKEGYRYKALSYILFNWIYPKYKYMIRLEIAQFLQDQEKNVHNYLQNVTEIIKEKNYYKTKVFDGILIHIALEKLRAEFPNKYVAVKTNNEGKKYILVNEYKQQNVK